MNKDANLTREEILKALNLVDKNFQKIVYHSDWRIANAAKTKAIRTIGEWVIERGVWFEPDEKHKRRMFVVDFLPEELESLEQGEIPC